MSEERSAAKLEDSMHWCPPPTCRSVPIVPLWPDVSVMVASLQKLSHCSSRICSTSSDPASGVVDEEECVRGRGKVVSKGYQSNIK